MRATSRKTQKKTKRGGAKSKSASPAKSKSASGQNKTSPKSTGKKKAGKKKVVRRGAAKSSPWAASKASAKKATGKKSSSRKAVSGGSGTGAGRQKVMGKKASPIKIDSVIAKKIHSIMVLSRVLEERMIQVYRKGEAYFWIGAPGEEAFGVPLGILANKGQGPAHDYLHLHYRGTPTLLAMGMDPEDSLRLIMNRATDPCTGGRNFSNHYCYPHWNVVPVSSPIEVQYSQAIGTGISQRRHQTKGVSIITGGDAGSAEGDFASCLIWASRPGFELPLYITIQNNRWGISTSYDTQHGEKHVSDRGKAFGMETRVYNGNDPVETYRGIEADLQYIRKTGKPVVAEFEVSRLFGHSSASGANRIEGEECCIEIFEKRLVDTGVITTAEIKKIWDEHFQTIKQAADRVRAEPAPEASTIWDHTYHQNENADWRDF